MEIREYEIGDEHAILELFEIVFKKKMSYEYWKWRFCNNPFTEDILIHLMWDGEKLVGQYALSPVEMKVGGELKKAALAMTLMTHPDYQGKGVFANLGQSMHKSLKKQSGYFMIFAFPNNQTHSHYGFVKNLGWNDITVIPMLSAKVTDLRFKVEEKTTYSCKTNFDESTKSFNSSEKLVSINKTHQYLNWRYLTNPSATYKILEVENGLMLAVYKIINSFSGDGNYEIDLMEVTQCKDHVSLSKTLNSIIDNEKDIKINKFNIWKSLFSRDQIIYEKLGFKINLPLNYLSHLNLGEPGPVSNFENWEIGLGYSDVF